MADVDARLVLSLLDALVRQGLLSREQVVRQCLSPDVLFERFAEQDKAEHAQRLAEAVVQLLEDPAHRAAFDLALFHWRREENRQRRELNFAEVEPAIRDATRRCAEELICHCEQQALVEQVEVDNELCVRITEGGLRYLDERL